MHNIVAIARKDFKNYFITPVGYLVLMVFAGIMGWMFCSAVFDFLRRSQAAMRFGGIPDMNVNTMIIQPMLGNMSIVFLFVVSFITMRLIAEERKMNTLELLLTSPVRSSEIVLGKFLSSLFFFILMLAITIVYPLALAIFGEPDFKQIAAGYLGVFLLGASFLSIGLFISSKTENQITAAALTFGLFLFFWVISWILSPSDSIGGQLISYVSIIDHLANFIRGLVDTRDVIYYISLIFFGLFLTHQSLESLRWKQ